MMGQIKINGVDVPEMLNGHRVRMAGAKKHDEAYSLILVETESEWVLASWHPSVPDVWSWGRYIAKDQLERAYRMFREMTQEGTRVSG